jgi:alkylation response protein AidB-like acyl-CoA dehydrogenase
MPWADAKSANCPPARIAPASLEAALAYAAAAALDLSQADPSDAQRARAAARLGLPTPRVKAWCSDTAVEVASLSIQVHGGRARRNPGPGQFR